MKKNNKLNDNSTNDCGRKEDLVAYLYDEAGSNDRASFERHLSDCDSCRNEISAFGRVRDDLSAWQVGFAPRTEIELPKRRLDALRDFALLFPVWARGAALTAAAASLLLFSLSFAGSKFDLKGFLGRGELNASINHPQIESMIKDAVARERAQIQAEYQMQTAQMAGFKQQIEADYQAQLQAANAAYEARLQAVKAGLKAEIKKANKENSSIRSFFAMDEFQDPWGDSR